MRIGEVATATGVPVKTLRYWEQVGVVEAPARDASGYRDYAAKTIDQIRFILSAQAVGLSLQVISGIIRLRSEGVPPCRHVEELLQQRLDEIDRGIEALNKARSEVQGLLERAKVLDPGECNEGSVCHLIADVGPSMPVAAVAPIRGIGLSAPCKTEGI